jgi:GT2 family glycosyltransferase
VIIADDGSSDKTRDIVNNYAKNMNIKYVFQEDEGYRPASVRNKGIRLAEGHICLFFDSGVLVDGGCLREHINFYKGGNSRAAVIGYVYGFERTKDSEARLLELINPYQASDTIAKLSKDELFFDIRDEFYNKYNDQIQDLPAPWFYFWTCHVSVPRAELLAIGLFDEKYDGRWGGEDNDLAYRLMQEGIKIHLLRSAKAIHYPHEKNTAQRNIEGFQNCRYFHSKFRTPETELFLDTYLTPGFVDINDIFLEIRNKPAVLQAV